MGNAYARIGTVRVRARPAEGRRLLGEHSGFHVPGSAVSRFPLGLEFCAHHGGHATQGGADLDEVDVVQHFEQRRVSALRPYGDGVKHPPTFVGQAQAWRAAVSGIAGERDKAVFDELVWAMRSPSRRSTPATSKPAE